jgi:hypothetical protein
MHCLALQGGGCLGYGQTLILSQAEQHWNRPSAAVFEMIGGTSVGSIIGACLSVGLHAKQIENFFTQEAPKIFKASWWNHVSSLWSPKYSPDQLEKSLQAVLGTKTLSDCKCAFIATAYDWASDRPVYFKSFENSSENEDYIVVGPDSKIMLWQVCRASSAAQTYFPAYEYNKMVLMDGGNTGDNAPDMLVLSEILNYTSIDKVNMLSLGSGNTNWHERPKSMVSPSLIRAGLETIKIVFSAGEDSQVYKAKYMLKDRHSRIVPDLGDGIAIDDASACLELIPKAVGLLTKDNSDAMNEIARFNVYGCTSKHKGYRRTNTTV